MLKMGVEMQVTELVDAVNREAQGHRFGELQELRRQAYGWRSRPSRTPFSTARVHDHYAFHVGGRTELQFNVGFKGEAVRYGVAFSFQLDQDLQSHEEVLPRVERFNEFLRLHPDEFFDLVMWHWLKSGLRSEDYPPTVIPVSLLKREAFVFLGRHVPEDQFDAGKTVAVLDRLMPLYEFVEGFEAVPRLTLSASGGLDFKPGHTPRVDRTEYSRSAERINAALRHNMLQDQLVRELVDEHGGESVGSECGDGQGGRVDIVLQHEEGVDFFEIKVASAARTCIRQAIGQLLEYGFWPGADKPNRLVVVGEPSLDREAGLYLRYLREEFGIPVSYQQVTVPDLPKPQRSPHPHGHN